MSVKLSERRPLVKPFLNQSSRVPKPAEAKSPAVSGAFSTLSSYFTKAADAVGDKIQTVKDSLTAKAINLKFSDETRQRDQNILNSVLYESPELNKSLETIRPQFYLFINKIASQKTQSWLYAKTNSGKILLDEVIVHILANLTCQQLPSAILRARATLGKDLEGYKLSFGQLIENIFFYLLKKIGPDLNELDRAISELDPYQPIPQHLFHPLVTHLLNAFLPKTSSLRALINDDEEALIDSCALLLSSAYQPIAIWLKQPKEIVSESESQVSEAEPEGNPFEEDFNFFIPFILGKVSDYLIEKNQKFFKKTTGEEHFQYILEKASQFIHPLAASYFPQSFVSLLDKEKNPDLSKNLIQAVTYEGLFYLTSVIAKRQIHWLDKISTDQLIHKILSFLSEQLHDAFVSAKNAPSPLKPKQFYPYLREFISLFLPKFAIGTDPSWLDLIIKRHQKKFLPPLAEICLSFFNATTNRSPIEQHKNSLRKLLWNRKAIKESRTFKGKSIPTRPSEKDYIQAGIEPFVQQVYNISYNLTTKIQQGAVKRISNKKKVAHDLEAMPEPLKTGMVEIITKIFSKDDHNIKWAGTRVHTIIHTILFSACVNFLENVAAEDRGSFSLLFFKAFNSLLEWGSYRLPAITKKIRDQKPLIAKEIKKAFSSKKSPHYIADSTLRFAAIQENIEIQLTKYTAKLLKKAVTELSDIFFKGAFADNLPVPKKLQELGAKHFQKQTARFLATILIKTTSWISDRKTIEDQIINLFGTDNFLKACNLARHMTAQGIPYFFRENYEKITEDGALPNLKSLLVDPKHPKKNIESDFLLKKMLNGFFQQLGESNSIELNKFMQFIGEFVETLLMHFFADLFKRIKKSEDEQNQIKKDKVLLVPPSVLENVAVSVIKESIDHFTGIGKTKQAVKKGQPARKDFLAIFHDLKLLHKALNDELLRGPIGKDSQKTFLIGLSQVILKIFDINEDSEIPVPDFLKSDVFEGLEKHVLPTFLKLLSDSLSDVATINEILISLLDHALDDMEKKPLYKQLFTKKMSVEAHPPFNDAYQKDLEKGIGDVIEALAKMQEDRLPQFLIKSKKLKAIVGSALGQPLRDYLRKYPDEPISILPLVDSFIKTFVDDIAPCVTRDPKTRSFIYYKTTVHPKTFKTELQTDDSGSPVRVDAPDFSHMFPKGEEAKQAAAAFEAGRRKEAKKNVFSRMQKIIDAQTNRIAVSAFLKAWERFIRGLRIRLIKSFGNHYGEKIFKFILPITNWLIKYPLSLGVLIFNYTIWLIVSPILKFMLNKQAKKGVKDVEAAIHDNFVFRLFDLILGEYAKELDRVDKDSSSRSSETLEDESSSESNTTTEDSLSNAF